jgi:hypothetical protein
MRSALRILAGLAMALWAGGFVFYSAFVLPVVKREAGETGFITRHVAVSLNHVGAAAAGLALAATMFAPEAKGERVRRVALAGFALSLGALYWMHGIVAAQVDAGSGEFYGWHRVYLWTSTAQLAFGIVWLAAGQGSSAKSSFTGTEKPGSTGSPASASDSVRTVGAAGEA